MTLYISFGLLNFIAIICHVMSLVGQFYVSHLQIQEYFSSDKICIIHHYLTKETFETETSRLVSEETIFHKVSTFIAFIFLSCRH